MVRKKVASLLPVLGAVDAVRCALSKAFSLLSGPVRHVRVRVRRFLILAGLAGDRAGLKSLKILSVNIPAGVDSGTRIRLSGKGEAGLRGAPAGDLYIFVNVRTHSIFEREGSHLFLRVPVPMSTAALGGSIEVPTLAGRMARLQIEKGTQTGRKFRMRGKGMPALRGCGARRSNC